MRPIRLVIPFTPAGTTDLVGRLAAERMSARLGQQVVVENRPGAGGNVGGEAVARAEPDGYTLLLTTIGTGAINFAVYGDKMPYKPADLAAVGLLVRVPNVLMAANGLPARNVAELVALTKARVGGLNYGSAGIGSSPHVCTELFNIMTGARMAHVPYRGSAPMQAELLGGALPLGFDVLPDTVENIRAGRLRAYAVTSPARQPLAPEVPTTAELGYPGIRIDNWVGLSGPANLPGPLLERLRAETLAAVAAPDVRRRLAERGITGEPLGPEAFAALVAEQVRDIGGLVAGLGMTLD